MGNRMLLFLGLAAILVCTGTPAVAQTTGDISGRVTDASEMPLPGVTIETTSSSLPGARISVTDANGAYRIPAIPPGTYRVRASLSGFRAAENSCTVALGSAMTVNLTLRIEAEEKVLVSGETPPIDTSSTTTGTNYTSDLIGRLPVSRNYADIVRANPGVSSDRGDTEGRFLALSIYGATSAENQWVIDGVDTTNVQKGIQGKAITSEFVQEIEVKTGGYQAEFGRALGGVINVITKSGGNAFHGDAFLYYDSTSTSADRISGADSPLSSMKVADGARFDYGADLGGFLLKDRIWFFGAYNRITLDGGLSRVDSAPHVSKDDRFPFDAVEGLYSGKVTWNAGNATILVGTALADPSYTSGAAGADPRQGLDVLFVAPIVSRERSTWYSTRTQGNTDFGLRGTRLFGSRALAAIQGGYHRDRNSITAADEIRYEDRRCVGGSPERRCNGPAEPNDIWGGYGPFGQGVSSRQQYSAGVSMFAGKHELKAGGDYLDGRTEAVQRQSGGQRVFLQNEFGQEYYRHFYFPVSRTDPTQSAIFRRAQVIDYGAYLQDSWRASSGFTVNVGMRWDGEVTHDYRGNEVLRFNNLWQPRVGVVWDPWRNGKTKVHAFAGRFSYALPTTAVVYRFANVPSAFVFNFDPVSLVQDPTVIGHRTAVRQGGAGGSAVDSNVKGGYQDELTVGIERALTPSLTAGLKGTYRNLGRALENRCDLDQSSPETGFHECAFINPGSNGRFSRGDIPTCDYLFDAPDGAQCFPSGEPSPKAKRLYRGIEFFARKTVRDRMWLQASYAYSSLRGNYDGSVNEIYQNQALGNTTPGNSFAFNLPFLWQNSYGLLSLDRTHRFRFDGYWVTPLRLAVGIQAFAESGAPLNRLGYTSFYGANVFLLPRGSAGRLPALWDANLTASYPISIGPVSVTLQGYLYNVFNNQFATARDEAWSTDTPAAFPDTIYDPNQEQNNPNYGRVTSRSAPRSFRAALKVAF
jgi:hypothetical protein